MKFAETFRKHKFLFEELTSRDFKQKYKRTILGMGWSLIYPLLTLFIQNIVFSQFFSDRTAHYTIYLFAGNIVFSYFREATMGGMYALINNAHIFSKVNVPKYIFVLTKNVSALINFGITTVVFFIFVAIDGVPFSWSFFSLVIPIFLLMIFNLGIGMILSAFEVFFRDIAYLYDVSVTVLMYLSAVFYTTDIFSPEVQLLFHLNPVYCYIRFFRIAVIDGVFPSAELTFLCFIYAAVALAIGAWVYKKNNHEFLYYV